MNAYEHMLLAELHGFLFCAAPVMVDGERTLVSAIFPVPANAEAFLTSSRPGLRIAFYKGLIDGARLAAVRKGCEPVPEHC